MSKLIDTGESNIRDFVTALRIAVDKILQLRVAPALITRSDNTTAKMRGMIW